MICLKFLKRLPRLTVLGVAYKKARVEAGHPARKLFQSARCDRMVVWPSRAPVEVVQRDDIIRTCSK